MVGRPRSQCVVAFVASPPDRLGMQTRDLGDSLESAMPQPLGLTRGHPATLLLAQPTQQKVELPMGVPFRMLTRPTVCTTAIMNRHL